MVFQSPIGKNRILELLSPEAFGEVQTYLRMILLKQGAVLHFSGERIETIFFPVAGMISLLTVLNNGFQIETGAVGRSGLAGGTIGNNGPYSFVQTTVQVEGAAYGMAGDRFLALFNKDSTFRSLVNEYNGYLYFQALQSAACLAVHPVEARLCRWMLQCQDVLQSDTVELTQEALSHMMGVQRNAVSLCAHSLQNKGLIEYSRGSIKILNRERLEKSACDCYDSTRNWVGRMTPAKRS